MTILADLEIASRCYVTKDPMISPFEDKQIRSTVRRLTDSELEDYYTKGLDLPTGRLTQCTNQVGKYPHVSVTDDCALLTQRVISYGLSSYGYDLRLAPEFMIIDKDSSGTLDPKEDSSDKFTRVESDSIVIEPNCFVLARTLEYVHLPKDITAVVTSKSTYARLGLATLTTVIEAGWHGHIVLEYANTTSLPIRLYANEGAAQLLFYKGSPCEVPYDDTRKYQGQTGITLSRL